LSALPPDEIMEALMGQINHVWRVNFQAEGKDYPTPSWEIVHKDAATPCGTCKASGTPFYCEKDSRVYLGIGFFEQIADQVKDAETARFVLGTVLAHEIGHYIQFLNGTGERLEAERAAREARGDHKGALQDSVELELQADAYSGVWAHHAVADMSDEATKSAILATFELAHAFDHDAEHVSTHGTGDQRMAWFQKGLDSGKPADCALTDGARPGT
jgi:predicted metalloprotease